MTDHAMHRKPGLAKHAIESTHPELALLGGRTRGVSHTRVMAANIRSRSARPADLDAILRGSLLSF